MAKAMGPDRGRKGSLVVVGTGIAGPSQLTLESLAAIDSADRVMYVVDDAVTERWLKWRSPSAVTLADAYAVGKDRLTTYVEMAARLIRAVQSGLNVCCVVYGHPGVFAQFTHIAIERLRRAGYPARMLPGVSADGCLFADIGWNPGDFGVQSFEATDFLRRRRRFDPTSALLLWQIGVLGDFDYGGGREVPVGRLRVLSARLQRYYPNSHRVVLYASNTVAGRVPTIKRLTLSKLATSRPNGRMTLFVPPLAKQRKEDPTVRRWIRASLSGARRSQTRRGGVAGGFV